MLEIKLLVGNIGPLISASISMLRFATPKEVKYFNGSRSKRSSYIPELSLPADIASDTVLIEAISSRS